MTAQSGKTISVLGVVAAIVIATTGAIWALAADRQDMSTGITANKVAVQDHEERIRTIEHTLPQMATDVRWIRQAMELNGDGH